MVSIRLRRGSLSLTALLAAVAASAAAGVVFLGLKVLDKNGPERADNTGRPAMTMADLINQTAGDASPRDVTGSLPPPVAPEMHRPNLGPVSKLPVPRFVSIKPERVNVRVGPTRNQNVAFVFQKSGVPVEITAEFENWRRIRDYEGSEGWVMQTMLSGKRTALIAPWAKEQSVPLYRHADAGTSPVAMLEPGVMATIKACSTSWCRIEGSGFDGWVEQGRLWGAYPGEDVE